MSVSESHPLIGRRIIDMATREFWLDGELITPCCTIFLKDHTSTCWQISYDDIECLWRVTLGRFEFPNVPVTTGDKDFQYRDVSIPDFSHIAKNVISKLNIDSTEYEALLKLYFANGYRIHCTNRYRDDEQSFHISSAD